MSKQEKGCIQISGLDAKKRFITINGQRPLEAFPLTKGGGATITKEEA
jgi:hypothetical protein